MNSPKNTEVQIHPALEAGVDYPGTYREFVTMFPDENACMAYLEGLRWKNGFVCPACNQPGVPWRQTRGRLVCPVCRRQASVSAGTILDKTRTPLTTWFEAAWHVTTAKNGISAKTLERTLGISYRVAWTMLHRYRVAMVRAVREKLSGAVEVDETLIGGVEQGGKRGRGTDKCIVLIAVEIRQPKGFGRVRMRHVPDASGRSLEAFVRDAVSPGSMICTDGWRGYNGLSNGYVHKQTVMSSSGDPAHVSMPGVHRISALIKRWLLGTHQGSFNPVHLQSYLEEYTFRFNRRTSNSRGLVFRRLLEQAVIASPVTENDLACGFDWNHSPLDVRRS
jgi:transposase-like protein